MPLSLPWAFLLHCLGWSARHGGALLAGGIVAGILVPGVAASLREAVTPAVALLMTLVLLRVDPRLVLGHLRRPALVAAMAAWILLACPLLAFAATRAVGLDGPLGAGFVLLAAACAATSSPAIARLVGLDAEICLVVAVVTTALVPLTAPPLAIGLLGVDLAIGTGGLMLRLGLLVGLPALLAFGLRRAAGEARVARAGPALDGVVVLVLVVFALGVMDGVQARLLADPLWVLSGIGLAVGGTLALNAVTVLAFRPAGRGIALAAGLLAGSRNQALFLAVLPEAADPGVLLFFALGQIPMFVTPLLLRPAYARIRPR